MLSAQDCAQRLREQAYKTLSPQIRDLEQELRNLASALSSGLQKIEQRLDALRNIELPTTETVLDEIFNEIRLYQEKQISSLALLARGLHQKHTQEEILSFLLDQVAVFFPRVALFSIRGDKLVGWSSRGFPETQAQNISHASLLRSECQVPDGVLESALPIALADIPSALALLQLLRENPTEVWHVMPLRVLKRSVALLLTGAADQAKSSIDALCVLAELASLRLENVALKILQELTRVEYKTPVQASRTEEPVATPETRSADQVGPVTAVAEQAPVHFAEQVEAVPPKPAPLAAAEVPPPTAPPAGELEKPTAVAAQVTAEAVSSATPAAKPAPTQPSEPLAVAEDRKSVV